MRTSGKNCGFTLVEMLLVVAIIVILISMMVGVAKRIDDQGKERLCRDTIELIGNALEQFRDFDYEYKHTDYAGLDFPLDCNGFFAADIEVTLQDALYSSPQPTIIITGANAPNFSGSEALYFILSQVPDCRITLDKVDKSLLTNKDSAGGDLILGVGTVDYPLLRFIDPWGTTLRYDYYDEETFDLTTKKTFPVITSAGADKQFDTADDISNIEQK